jgi:hypothetical protein
MLNIPNGRPGSTIPYPNLLRVHNSMVIWICGDGYGYGYGQNVAITALEPAPSAEGRLR